MKDSMLDRLDDHEPLVEPLDIPQPRAVGSPLPRGNGARVPLPMSYEDLEKAPPRIQAGPVLAPPPQPPAPEPVMAPQQRLESAPSAPPRPPRALPAPPSAPPTGFQRAVEAFRTALPVVQKLLPLLEGNIAATVANILAPQPKPAPPPPPVDLSPVQQSIAELQTQHRNLRDQVSEQNACLNRVKDQLEAVREATDRNTLEQQELLQDLKSMGSKVNLVAAIAIGLLAISLLVNMALFMHIQRVLP